MHGLRLVVVFLAAAQSGTAYAQVAEPFHTRNLSPPLAIFGLPTWQPMSRAPELTVTTEIANHYRLAGRETDALILDGETWRVNTYYAHPVGRRWSVSAELPLVRQSGGILDPVIDAWHRAFNMPIGGRENPPSGEMLFWMARGSAVLFERNTSGSGLGDAQLTLARGFGPDQGFVLRAMVKVPTGDEEILAGSGAADWSITMLRSREVVFGDRPAGYFWGAGWLALGQPDVATFPVEDGSVVGIFGGTWQAFPRIGLKVQIDFYSAAYDTPLEELGQDAVQTTFGAWWNTGENLRVEIGVSEDLHVSTAPDVTLHVGLHWKW